MNFTYAYIYDSDNDFLSGNITWAILDFEYLSHWAHSEDFCKLKKKFCGKVQNWFDLANLHALILNNCSISFSFTTHFSDEGIYNTYVIDTDYENWALMMNCAEKKKNPRYLSALLMSRRRSLGHNVKVYLREKLPKYNIDLDFMFAVEQDKCDNLIPSVNMKYYYDHFLKRKFSDDSAHWRDWIKM